MEYIDFYKKLKIQRNVELEIQIGKTAALIR
jgi:hypothetical protein